MKGTVYAPLTHSKRIKPCIQIMLGNFLGYYYNNIFLWNSFPNSAWYFLRGISPIKKKTKKTKTHQLKENFLWKHNRIKGIMRKYIPQMLWFPLVCLAPQNRLRHGLGRAQLRGFIGRQPQSARSNVLQMWTVCQAVCFIKGGLGSSSSIAGIDIFVVHQNSQSPQMEGWRSVCSSA